jgi:RND family efflux transporter MFP subunit
MADNTRTLRRAKLLTVSVLALLVLLGGRTVFSRISSAKALENGTAERAKVYVRVTSPSGGEKGRTVSLPGTLQGFVQAPIAARANGYVKRWYKDIGSRVKKGEALADLEAPEIDQQLSQAVASRDQASSSLELARSTVARWENLRKREVVSQQELDERRSADMQARANLAAADANVERLKQLEGFKRVVAPFEGVITKRNVDVGDLIDAGGNRPLFLLSQTDPLRVYVNVPQSYAQQVKTGQQVVVTQAELRERSFKGEISRTSASIDAVTRTMQVEITLPNRDGTLMPGAFVQVALPLPPSDALTVPGNAILFRPEGPRVAAVSAESRITLRPVKIGRNFGEVVEVLAGVERTERVVLNPPDSLNEGDTVVVVQK